MNLWKQFFFILKQENLSAFKLTKGYVCRLKNFPGRDLSAQVNDYLIVSNVL